MAKQHPILSAGAIELVADLFKVLGEPSRLRILQAIRQRERSVSELVVALGMSQPTVSKNLKILLQAGLVARRPEGKAAFYGVTGDLAFALCDLVCERLAERLNAQASLLHPRRSRKLRA